MALRVEISKGYAYHTGELVAYRKGATFTESEFPIPFGTFKTYVIAFADDADATDTLYATTDAYALEMAASLFTGDYDVWERITTTRPVARVRGA